MSLRLFLSALRAHFGVLLAVLAITIATAVVMTLMLPKTYKSTASLLLDQKIEESMGTVPYPHINPLERIGYMQTQTDIITSRKVAGKVADDLKLVESPAVIEGYAKVASSNTSAKEWVINNLLQNLKVQTTQSNVIHLTYSSADPDFASKVANAFAAAYIDTMLELRVEPSRKAATWFDEQLKALRANLGEAQTRLTNYQRRHGIIADDERSDIEGVRLVELSSQVARAQDLTLDWGSRLQQASDMMQRGASPDRLPEVLNNTFIQALKTDLLRGEAKLQDLSSQYGVNYPLYQRQLSENRSLREKLDSEMKKVVSGLESTVRQSREREGAARAAFAAQRARLLDLKQNRGELAVLMRDADSAQRAYDTAMQQAAINKVGSRTTQANVALLTAAVASAKPFRPRLDLNVGLSAIIGTILGLALIMLMETFDRRVRVLEDLTVGADVPLIGVINTWQPAEQRLLLASPVLGKALPSPH